MLVILEIVRFSSTYMYVYILLILLNFIESFQRKQLTTLLVRHIQISWFNIIKWTSAWLFPSECMLNSWENWFSIIWAWGEIITQKLYNTFKDDNYPVINIWSYVFYNFILSLILENDVLLFCKFHLVAVI